MEKAHPKLKKIVELDKKIRRFPKPSPIEKALIEAEQRFEATYYSNKLEGNKLSKGEAKKAVLAE